MPPPLGVGDPRDPRCLHARLRALLERQREEEERMFSRLRLDGPLGESTEKEVQTGLFTNMPLPKSHPLHPNDLISHFIKRVMQLCWTGCLRVFLVDLYLPWLVATY